MLGGAHDGWSLQLGRYIADAGHDPALERKSSNLKKATDVFH